MMFPEGEWATTKLTIKKNLDLKQKLFDSENNFLH